MAKKQTSTKAAIKETVAPVVPPRAAKPNAPRARTAKHSKAITVEPAVIIEESVADFAMPVADVMVEDAMMEDVMMEEAIVAANPVANPREAIEKLAYGYWAARGFQGGDALEDWVRAEREYGIV